MFTQTDDAKARQAFRLPDFFKLNPAEADRVRREGKKYLNAASRATKIREYPVSEVIFHHRTAGGFWFNHYGIQVSDEVIDFIFLGEGSAIVGVGVARRPVSRIPAMRGASVHPVGCTVFSPPAVEGIGIQIESALSITSSASFGHSLWELPLDLLELHNIWPNPLGFDCPGVDPCHKLASFSSA